MEFPNLDSNNDFIDILYSNYYTKFLSNAHNYQDASMNIVNLKRHADVDIFYILKYKKQILMIQHIIIACCVALIGSVLYHNGLITSDMYTMYLIIVFSVGILIFIYDMFDIFMRNNNNFNEYDFEFIYSPSKIPKSNTKNYNSVELSNMPTIC
jgi:hypothetical protein